MSVYVFTGPTLAAAEARQTLDATYLPPAAQGDVYRAARLRPRAIGIIDGYFERLPAVWHKEILWAMAEGVHVFGSASIGALRAAELEPFGMEGVGSVYRAYLEGQLEDDDEVAVIHGPPESGYRAISEAMVNIRATLAAAEDQGVLEDGPRRALERIAKRLFYPERTYQRVLELGRSQGLPAAALERLDEWLPGGRIDQKRQDALEMLGLIGERLRRRDGRKAVRYSFQHTAMWDQLARGGVRGSRGLEVEDESNELLLDELRLAGRERYAATLSRAQHRALATEIAADSGVSVTRERLEQAAEALHRRHRLRDAGELEGWMKRQQLDRDGLEELLATEARLAWVDAVYETDARRQLPDLLRSEGSYAELRRRAAGKRRRLEAAGLFEAGIADTGLDRQALLRWHFRDRLETPVPDDLERYAHALGLAGSDELLQLVARDYLYRRLVATEGEARGGPADDG